MASNLLARTPPLFVDLSKVLEGEIDCNQKTLQKYSTDMSPYQIFPQAVVYPKNSTDIKHVLSFAREIKMPVTVRGTGSGSNGGSLGEGIVLDTSRYFTRVRSVNMLENTITVDAGVTVGHLLEQLHSWNVDIPFLFGVDKNTTIGSIISTKTISGSSFYHGTMREWVEGLTVVVDNGEEHHIADGITPSGRLLGIYQAVFPFLSREGPLIRASKPKSGEDSTGYTIWNTSIGPRQLLDQLVGSEGTLGIITSATLRLAPFKKNIFTTYIPVQNPEQLIVCMDIAKHHKAEHIFFIDEQTATLSKRYLGQSIPSFAQAQFILIVSQMDNNREHLTHRAVTLKKAFHFLEEDCIQTQERELPENIASPQFLKTLSEAYGNGSLTASSITSGLIVPHSQITQFLKEIRLYTDSQGLFYTLGGNIGSGHVHVNILLDPMSKKYEVLMFTLARDLFLMAKKYHGGISAVGGDGISKSPFITCIYNEQTIELFKTIKQMWDPLLILNPGKKLGHQIAYLQTHLKRT